MPDLFYLRLGAMLQRGARLRRADAIGQGAGALPRIDVAPTRPSYLYDSAKARQNKKARRI
jgi:hypothetical protein